MAWRAVAIACAGVACLCLTLAGAGAVSAADDAPVHLPVVDPSTLFGIQREAVLGIELAAIQELLDEPDQLFTPESQRFLDQVFSELEKPLPGRWSPSGLAAIREKLRTRESFAAGPVRKALESLSNEHLQAIGVAAADTFVLGALAQQLDFNGRILQEPGMERDGRAFFATSGVLDNLIPNFAYSRRALGAPSSGDLYETAAQASAVVRRLTAPVAQHLAADTPIAVGVFAALLTGSGPRHRSYHIFVDVVRAGGAETTIGAYPDGTYDFNRTGGRLVCKLNEEPRALPKARLFLYLTPPAGQTMAAFAKRFPDACAEFNAHKPLRYSPLGAAGTYNDNSFGNGLLRHLATPSDYRRVGAAVNGG